MFPIIRNGYAPAKKILHAQILLICDQGTDVNRKWTDKQIAVALNLHRNTVALTHLGAGSLPPATSTKCLPLAAGLQSLYTFPPAPLYLTRKRTSPTFSLV